MASQDVRVTSLPDNSNAAVAYRLWDVLRLEHGGETLETKLRLYAACRRATSGLDYDITGLG